MFARVFDGPFVSTQEYVDNFNRNWEGYYSIKNEDVGKIIINGTGDNSIPYALHDMIEEKFHTSLFHLG